MIALIGALILKKKSYIKRNLFSLIFYKQITLYVYEINSNRF